MGDCFKLYDYSLSHQKIGKIFSNQLPSKLNGYRDLRFYIYTRFT